LIPDTSVGKPARLHFLHFWVQQPFWIFFWRNFQTRGKPKESRFFGDNREKSTCGDNREKSSEERSNTAITICKHEQGLYEDERIYVTKEALKFNWYEELEDWDHHAPDADDDDSEEMTRRHRELYSSFLRLSNLEKKTTSNNDNNILPSDQKKEIQTKQDV